MKTIFKYPAPIGGALTIDLPAEAEILCVQMQGEAPQIWARVDTDNPRVPRRFHWRGTGHDAAGLGQYIGTVQSLGGRLIFHLFED